MIRYKETAEDRIRATALEELGAEVAFDRSRGLSVHADCGCDLIVQAPPLVARSLKKQLPIVDIKTVVRILAVPLWRAGDGGERCRPT
jgi:hypothetical protein